MRRMSKKHGGSQSSPHLNELSIEDLRMIANAMDLSLNGSQTKQQLIQAIDMANGTEVSLPEQEPEMEAQMEAQTFEHQLKLATQQCHKCYEELIKNTDVTSDKCKILVDRIRSPEFVNSLSKTLLKAHFTKIGYTSDQIAQGIEEAKDSVEKLDLWLKQNAAINVTVHTLNGSSYELGLLPISSNMRQVKTHIAAHCGHKVSTIKSLMLQNDYRYEPQELTDSETLYDSRTYCTPKGKDPKTVQSINLYFSTYTGLSLNSITRTSLGQSLEAERGNTDYEWRLLFSNKDSLLIEGRNKNGLNWSVIRHYRIKEPNGVSKLTWEQYNALQTYQIDNPMDDDTPYVREMLNSKDLKPDDI